MPLIDGYYYFDNGTTGGSYTVTNFVWSAWNTTSTSNTITFDNAVWNNWVQYPAQTTYQPWTIQPWVDPRTPEQIEAARVDQERRNAEWREEQERLAAEKAEAAVKARVILEENLSAEQRKQLADNNWFEVITAKGTYRIRKGWAGNVDRYVDGKPADRFCIHPVEEIPHEDNMLAQKLLLEADEEAFLRIANRSHFA
jgi:hypothetical protein